MNGYVVTDRALFKLEKGGPLGARGPPAGSVRPRCARWPRAADRDARARIDEFALPRLAPLRAPTPPDLEAVYLPGLDIATMQQLGEGGVAGDWRGLDARLDAVRAYYRLATSCIGEACRRA